MELVASISAAATRAAFARLIRMRASRESHPRNADAELQARRATKHPLRSDVHVETAQSELLDTETERDQIIRAAGRGFSRAIHVPGHAGSDEGDEVDALQRGNRKRKAHVDGARVHTGSHPRRVADADLRSECARRVVVTPNRRDCRASRQNIEASSRTVKSVSTAIIDRLTVLPPLVAAGDTENRSAAPLEVDPAG